MFALRAYRVVHDPKISCRPPVYSVQICPCFTPKQPVSIPKGGVTEAFLFWPLFWEFACETSWLCWLIELLTLFPISVKAGIDIPCLLNKESTVFLLWFLNIYFFIILM